MAEREEQADAERLLALLHQLARHIVDGGDVVGVHRVAQAEAVGEEGGAEQDRIVVEGREGPGPDGDIDGDQPGIERDDLSAGLGGTVVEQPQKPGRH